MQTGKIASMIIIIIGIGMLAASLLADMSGLGGDPGFGFQQTIGTITGGVIAAVGVYLYAQSKK